MRHDRSSDRLLTGALGAYFLGNATILEALTGLCDAALEEVRGATMASIAMTVEGRLGTFVFTDPVVVEVDQAQYDAGEGPTVDAFHDGVVTVISSMPASRRYPAFCAAARDHGLQSVISTPLDDGRKVVGALNLYATKPYVFETMDLHISRRYAADAAFVLLNQREPLDTFALSQSLRQSLDARATIEQAKGIIMASAGCTPEEALDQLRRCSDGGTDPLHVVAGRMVHEAQCRSARDRQVRSVTARARLAVDPPL